MSQKTTIFISTHKPTEYVKDSCFQLIQVGAGLQSKKIPDAISDDTGDNISAKNPSFCELTAQYWAWRNCQSDYIGIFHYRRYLSFNPNLSQKPDVWGNLVADYIDESTIQRYGLTSEQINKVIEGSDIILPVPKDIRSMPGMGHDLREQYSRSGDLKKQDLEIMLSVLKEKYPDFYPYAEQFLSGHTAYLNNMFIMRREIFATYSEWLFDILFECDRRMDYTGYSTEALRTPGHLAERLLNIYIAYLKEKGNYKIRELPTVFFLSTDPVPDLQPAFTDHDVVITLAANDKYTPYLATTITSIRNNSTTSSNYDLLVMHQDITEQNRERLSRIIAKCPNFSLRFINISRYKQKFSNLFLRGHFSIETWYRLILPEILPHYQKILYLDSDLVADHDVAELFREDISDYLLAACRDADTAGLYNTETSGKKSYMDEILKISQPYDYFQAGILLLNLEKFRETYTTEQMLQFAMSHQWELLDQDVLNFLAQGKVKYVDMAWNMMYDWDGVRQSQIISHAPQHLQEEYKKARQHPYIIHYAGPDKPWHDASVDFGDVFWHYCQDSGFYELALQELFNSQRKSHSRKTRAKKFVSTKILPQDSKLGQLARKTKSYLSN